MNILFVFKDIYICRRVLRYVHEDAHYRLHTMVRNRNQQTTGQINYGAPINWIATSHLEGL